MIGPEQILHDLASSDPWIAERATREALALPPEEVFNLARLEARQFQERRKQRARNTTRVALPLILGSVGLIVTFFGSPVAVIIVCGLILWGFVIAAALVHDRLSRTRGRIAEIIALSADPRMLGPALDIAAATQSVDRYSARANGHGVFRATSLYLKHVLPSVRADMAALLTPKQRAALLHIIDLPFGDVDLSIAALKALEQAGDTSAIPVVEKLATRTRTVAREDLSFRVNFVDIWAVFRPVPSRSIVRLQSAAAECLEYLRVNAGRMDHLNTLLRASSSQQVLDVASLPRVPDSLSPGAASSLLRGTDTGAGPVIEEMGTGE